MKGRSSDDTKLRELFDRGLSDWQIARALGNCSETIAKARRRLGFPPTHTPRFELAAPPLRRNRP